MYNFTHSDFIQMDTKKLQDEKLALEGSSVDPIFPRRDEFSFDDHIDEFSHINKEKMMDQFMLAMKMYGWIADNANIIAIASIFQFFLIAIIILANYWSKKNQYVSHQLVANEDLHSTQYNISSASDEPLPIMPNSVRHRPTKALEIPDLSLDELQRPLDDNFNERPRKISHTSIFSHNNETGSIEMLHNGSKKYHSPNDQNLREFKISKNQGFGRVVKTHRKFEDIKNTPIYEEHSNSVSPNTSFKKIRSAFATHQEKQIHESYYSVNGEVVREVSQRKVTRYSDTPLFRKILSDNLFPQDPQTALPSRFSKQKSFNMKIPDQPLLTPKCKIDTDFTDNSFANFGAQKVSSKKSKNHYQRTNRSKTFKEDDAEFFFPENICERSRNTTNMNVSMSQEEDFKSQLNINSDRKHSKHSKNTDKANQIALFSAKKPSNYNSPKKLLGRVIRSTKSDYLKKETEESVVVQNPDDVSHEKEIIDFVRQHETSKKEETSGIYENYQPVTEIQESALTKIEIEENGKVSEFSNGSSSQGRKEPSVLITERVVESFTQRPLSAFSSNDDDKCQSSSDIPQRIVDCK